LKANRKAVEEREKTIDKLEQEARKKSETKEKVIMSESFFFLVFVYVFFLQCFLTRQGDRGTIEKQSLGKRCNDTRYVTRYYF
jgi:hypothetical protein